MYMQSKSIKRNISFLLCISILACLLTVSSAFTASGESLAAQSLVYGDLNDDGAIDAIDNSLLKQYLLGKITAFPSPQGETAADVNKDKSIDALDLSLMKQYLLGIIVKFPDAPTNPREIIIPTYSQLKTNTKLPDPFKFWDGTSVTSKADWTDRRAEISAFAQAFEYGTKPPKPTSVTGSYSNNTVTVNCTENGKTISFNCKITYPSTGKAPYPAVIGIGYSTLNNTEIAKLGVAVITFPCDEIAAQVNAGSRGNGKFYTLYGSNHSAGALMAWAWGVSRLIDVLETTPTANIDATKLGVTGGSRYGKGALTAGAFDDRIALTIPQESGSGGAASWRVSDAQKQSGSNVQTLSQIVTENCWYMNSFSQFGNSATRLPFDHHMIEGLCAPRGLLVIENTSMEWLGNVSCFTTGKTAHMIYEALGVPNNMGYSSVGHPDHCGYPNSQIPELQAFIKKFLLGDTTVNTTIMKQDGGISFDKSRWVDWTIPTLQ